ncbi:tetratricopeptide repeat protein [Pseudaestuariivita rosea]|uniref:tetratricopeptide repeat protein n=1 Tax=Pseudaestuariivita rosea TaxID=2763263 RepID=UPI001ABB5339|nr:tetratricopeptide repeat protein [Pseudaestuariivita rosea]
MGIYVDKLKLSYVTILLTVGISLPLSAQQQNDAELLERLGNATPESYRVIERELMLAWSKSGSASMDLLLERAQDAIELNDYHVALQHLTALTDHAPDFAEAFHLRATAYYELEMYGPALADLERTLELNPNHFGAMTGVGFILEELGHPDAALRALRKVKELHPNYVDIDEMLQYLEGQVEGRTL